VWHDSFICVTWLIHMSDMTHSYVWHDSFICVTSLIYTRDTTHLYVRCDSCILRVTWLIISIYDITTCMHAHMHVCTCTCVYSYTRMHVYTCIYVCICIYMHLCVYKNESCLRSYKRLARERVWQISRVCRVYACTMCVCVYPMHPCILCVYACICVCYAYVYTCVCECAYRSRFCVPWRDWLVRESRSSASVTTPSPSAS